MQKSVGLDGLQGLDKGLTTVEPVPSAGMSMPLNVEAIIAGPIEANERCVELFAEVFRESRSVALDKAIARTVPFAVDIDAIVEFCWGDGQQEPRLQDPVDELLAGRSNATLLSLGEFADGHGGPVQSALILLQAPHSTYAWIHNETSRRNACCRLLQGR
jgi:hypothetical protein